MEAYTFENVFGRSANAGMSRFASITLLIFSILISISLSAQLFPRPAYPKGYLRNPLAIPIALSGNFGEIRSNHYHMGLDIKTRAAVNQPVYAAADGYIARIKIEPFGFGRALYINHPNGFTTVYAHLNDFTPALEAWVKQQQYKAQSWNIFPELTPELFPVKKGDFIAYSGNTGGSQAPHLHFEVRRTADDVNLNPLLFGLPFADNVKPKIARFAIYDANRSIYEQSPVLVPVKAGKTAGSFITTPGIIEVSSPIITIATGCYDTHTGGTNHIGVFESTLFIDDSAVIAFRTDQISYNDTRFINAHIDYKTKARTGANLQLFWRLQGYPHSIYSPAQGNDGRIDISDKEVHTIRIIVKDAYDNQSVLTTKVKYNGKVQAIAAAGKLFRPLMVDGFESDECEFFIGEYCLYAPVRIGYSKATGFGDDVVSSVHTIGNTSIPLQQPFLIRIKPVRSLTDIEKSRTVMQWFAGSKRTVEKVEWQQNWAAARFRDFGSYRLVVDMEPPVITPVGFADSAKLQKASRIVFTVKDNLDDFKNVRTELDDNWLRFTNDKGRTFIYVFDEKCAPGQHELKITAEDEAGNVATKVFRFTR